MTAAASSPLTLRTHASLSQLDAAAWDALVPGGDPFLSYAFLHGLERHGCLRPRWGWSPLHHALYDGDRLVAAAPGYLKGNSHGEFVFDHAWAHAYERHGLAYYPKLLCAVPYSPVTGARLLVADDARAPALRGALVAVLERHSAQLGLSGAHVNFVRGDDVDALRMADGWIERHDWQFHWHHRGYRDFADFLDAFTAKKRKNVRQERERVARSGLEVRLIDGTAIGDEELRAMHDFYALTFQHKGNLPVLSLEFFRHLAQALREHFLVAMAFRGTDPVAGALLLRSDDTLYGRYWGATEDVPGLHFELCYYRGVEYCIEHGLSRFEPGAQGEHKIARGFEPTLTRSFHRLHHPDFARAIADWAREEREWVAEYGLALRERSPFRAIGAAT